MSTLRSKVGGILVKPSLKKTLKIFELEEHGGAPMLGLNGLIIKTHGSAKSIEFKNSILQCVVFKQNDINGKINAKLAKNVNE